MDARRSAYPALAVLFGLSEGIGKGMDHFSLCVFSRLLVPKKTLGVPPSKEWWYITAMRRLSAVLVLFMLMFTVPGFARGGSHSSPRNSSAPRYGGVKHTASHGGKFLGGSGGSTHKGATYRNPSGGKNYGRHKKP